jgi:hypothetical protein
MPLSKTHPSGEAEGKKSVLEEHAKKPTLVFHQYHAHTFTFLPPNTIAIKTWEVLKPGS